MVVMYSYIMIDDIDFLTEVSKDREIQEDYDIITEENFTEELCNTARELRSNGKTYMEIADELNVSPRLIPLHVKGTCECETQADPIENDKPWTERELMKYLHQSDNCWHRNEIANFLGCHQETIKNWISEKHHGLKVIDDSDRTSSQNVTRIHRLGIQLQEASQNDFVETVQNRLENIQNSDKSLKERYDEISDRQIEV